MYSIGQLIKDFQVSRSTLIYYDKIGLLSPAYRSTGNYRQYSQADYNRMIQIVVYKEAGLSLETIAELLASPGTKAVVILEQRLKQLNHQINQLRQQQQLVIKLLNKESLLRQAKVMTVDQWVKMLEAAGMDAEARRQWHREFERAMPEAHTDFLESLGMEKAEIKRIKTQYQ